MTAWMNRSRNKFGARKTFVGEIAFPSALEASVYQIHLLRMKAGEITDLRLQDCVRFPGTKIKSKMDFSFTVVATGRRKWSEAKGRPDRRWAVIKQLWQTHGPGELEVWMGTWRTPMLKETITPQLEKGGNHEHKEKGDQEG